MSSVLKDFQAELTFKDISSRAIWLKMLKKARDQCDKRFKYKLRLKTVHIKEKPFICELCSKGFSIKKDLHTHMESFHEDNEIMCELCGKSFSWTSHAKFLQTYDHSSDSIQIKQNITLILLLICHVLLKKNEIND